MLGEWAFGKVSLAGLGFEGVGFVGDNKCARRSENIWSEAYILLPDFFNLWDLF
jgi:hypothetical protein